MTAFRVTLLVTDDVVEPVALDPPIPQPQGVPLILWGIADNTIPPAAGAGGAELERAVREDAAVTIGEWGGTVREEEKKS